MICDTRYFGKLEFDSTSELSFPVGLPGFEQLSRFVAISQESTAPLMYLQSLDEVEICFICLPAALIDPAYHFELSDEDERELGISDETVRANPNLISVLAIITFRESGVTANLMAPIVLCPSTRKGVQSFCGAGTYSHQHRLDGQTALEQSAC